MNSFASVVIKLSDVVSDQRHLGICYLTENDEYSVLDLCWHNVLKNRVWSGSYLSFTPKVDDNYVDHLLQAAALCRLVWHQNQSGIPYAFGDFSNGIESETGSVLIGATRYGFTCSSFVLAIFEAAGISIVDIATWPVGRDDDLKVQERVVAELQKTANRGKTTQEHVEHVRSEIGSVRFRPEEVAAAADHAPLPATFDDISQKSLDIICRLEEQQNSQTQETTSGSS